MNNLKETLLNLNEGTRIGIAKEGTRLRILVTRGEHEATVDMPVALARASKHDILGEQLAGTIGLVERAEATDE